MTDDPGAWIEALAPYQRGPIQQLLGSGLSFDQVAERWLTAATANTFRFGGAEPVTRGGSFSINLKNELTAFLCGDKKYKTERDGLFGEKSFARTYVVSAIAVAITPHLSVASVMISPAIALLLASMGKIMIAAWCASQSRGGNQD